jgi:hypothetical protein
LGSGRKGSSASFGSVASAVTAVRNVGKDILGKALQSGALAIGAAAFPQFAGTIYAGYMAYQGAKKIVELKKDYEKLHGSTEEKIVKLAAKEGVKALTSEMIGLNLDKLTDDAIQTAINTSASYLSRNGVFSEMVHSVGYPDAYAADLRFFYTTTAMRSLKGAYSEAKDAVSTYVERGITP